jgi:hypothetical protein
LPLDSGIKPGKYPIQKYGLSLLTGDFSRALFLCVVYMNPTSRLVLYIFLIFQALWCDSLQADVARENKIKAAYIYHIINFIQWPDVANTASQPNRINVCLLGDTEFKSSLAPLAREATSPIDVVVNHSLDSVNGCHILYFAQTSPEHTRDFLAHVCRRPILTLGDTRGFARAGGMIGFVIHDNNVRLEVNVAAARQSRITISAKLLEVALNIIDEPDFKCQ